MSRRFIRFHYALRDPSGAVIDSSRGKEPMFFIQGAGQLVDTLESEILELKKGDCKTIALKTKQASSQVPEVLSLKVKISQLPTDKPKVGDTFLSNVNPFSEAFEVKAIEGDHVTLEGKNPLADTELTLDVEVVEDRQASEQELSSLLLFKSK